MERSKEDNEELMNLIAAQLWDAASDTALDIEFPDTEDSRRPFRTEWAFESITQRGSRFKRRSAEG